MIKLKKVIYWAGFVVFLSSIYLLTLFVVASYLATSSGPIMWGQGWHETMAFISRAEDE
jgi:hypothetical protein